MKKPLSGYVYVASVIGHPNLCKIGCTRQDPKNRVRNLKNEYKGYDFELYGYAKTDYPEYSEHSTHSVLYYAHCEREIFNVSPCEAMVAVNRGLNKHFTCMPICEPYISCSKYWIAERYEIKDIFHLSNEYCLAIANLCIERNNIYGTDAMYSIEKEMIVDTLEYLGMDYVSEVFA